MMTYGDDDRAATPSEDHHFKRVQVELIDESRHGTICVVSRIYFQTLAVRRRETVHGAGL